MSLKWSGLTAAMFLFAARFANQPGWRWYSVASGVAFPMAFVATAVLFAQATASDTQVHIPVGGDI